MENIGYTHSDLAYKATEKNKIIPFRFDFNIFTEINKQNLSAIVTVRLLLIALTLLFLSNIRQASALEKQQFDTRTQTIKTSLETPAVGSEDFTLRLDSRGAEVSSLQKRLQQIKYYKGKITGYFGPYTENVVKQFQTDKKLTADGIVGAKTQQAIDNEIKKINKQSKPVKSSSSTLPLTIGSCSNGKCPILRAGDKGKSRYVKYLQTRLSHWGYFRFNPNGNFDAKTVEAVKRFQQNRKLSPDGVVGMRTWQQIETKNNPSNKCNKPLQRGDKGECVINLQKKLGKLGYFKTNPTSYYGSSTWEAVKQFQLNNELPPNGIVDSQTWKLLDKVIKEKVRNNIRYVVVIPVTSPYTLDEVRRFVTDAFIRNSRLGKYVQVGEFEYSEGAQKYSLYLRDRGFNAQVFEENKL